MSLIDQSIHTAVKLNFTFHSFLWHCLSSSLLLSAVCKLLFIYISFQFSLLNCALLQFFSCLQPRNSVNNSVVLSMFWDGCQFSSMCQLSLSACYFQCMGQQLSGCPRQVNFVIRQFTFPSHLPNSKSVGKSSAVHWKTWANKEMSWASIIRELLGIRIFLVSWLVLFLSCEATTVEVFSVPQIISYLDVTQNYSMGNFLNCLLGQNEQKTFIDDKLKQHVIRRAAVMLWACCDSLYSQQIFQYGFP